MVLARHTASAFVLVMCLTGCVVSFEDYPLSALGRGGDSGAAAVSGLDVGGTAAGEWLSDSGGASAGSDAPLGSPGGSAGMMMPDPLLLDDFEDGDSRVLLVAGRNGSWFTANDGSGQQSPDPHMDAVPTLLSPPRGASTRALHTSGSGFTDWGAMVSANFVVTGTTATPYDISAYTGLTFLAKVGKAGTVKEARVSIRNFDTLYGCTSCGDNFGASATFGDTFQTVTVPFSSLKQQGWGKPQLATFDTKRTYALTFAWAVHQTFDVWIDDVSFY